MATPNTMAQYNKAFVQNNPQYGSNINGVVTNPSEPKPGQSAYVPDTGLIGNSDNLVGAKAKSPQSNLDTPPNSIPADQTDKSNPYPGLVSKLADYNPGQDPGVQKALAEQRGFENSYQDINNNLASRPNPFGFQTGVGAVEKNRYAALAPVYQSQVSTAAGLAGQKLSALSSATSASAPTTQFGVLTSPVGGKPIGGGTPQDAAFTGATLGAVQEQGKDYQTKKGYIAQAQALTNQFNSMLAANPDFNSNPTNLTNTLINFWKNNQSNPNNPQLQSSLNNILNYYSQVFGKDQLTSLITQAQGKSLQQILSGLDSQATTSNEATRSVATGPVGAAAPVRTQTGGPFSPSSWQ